MKTTNHGVNQTDSSPDPLDNIDQLTKVYVVNLSKLSSSAIFHISPTFTFFGEIKWRNILR